MFIRARNATWVSKRAIGISGSGRNCDAMCWFVLDATIFRSMSWFSGMLWSFVTRYQDDYKDGSNCDVMCWFWFVWDATILRLMCLVCLGCYVLLWQLCPDPLTNFFTKESIQRSNASYGIAWASLRCIIIINQAYVRHKSKHYAPQTKILEGLTKDEIRIFDWLFNGS
jgi:hypothetical protein